jgi:hypothetical protein
VLLIRYCTYTQTVISHEELKNIMSIQIEEYKSQLLEKIYHQYDLNGGSLRFYTWELNLKNINQEESTQDNIHKVVARQTIQKLNYETDKRWNSVVTEYKRSEYPNLQIDYNELDDSGIQLSVDEFLGFDYDWIKNKPKFKGKKNGKHWYFDFDNHEYDEQKGKLKAKGIEHNRGFIQAFFFPPNGMNLGEKESDVLKYFDDFTKTYFDEMKALIIYAWSINCTHFFEFGKKWWGSYFWTVYNPTKNIYIGIVGSDSD